MNTRVLLAFLAGVTMASGVFYFAVSHRTEPEILPVAVQTPAPPDAPAPAVPVAAPAPEPSAPATPAPPPMARKPRSAAKAVVETEAKPAPEPAPAPAPVFVAPPVPTREPEPAPLPEPPRRVELQPAPGAETKVTRAPEPRPAASVTLSSGILLQVRLSETLASNRNAAGDTFSAALDEPLVVDGLVIAEKGARVEGRVVAADQPRRLQGQGRLVVELTGLSTADGQHIAIRTAPIEREAEGSVKGDVTKVAIGSALGAIIGAAAGGGKGAAIGAAAGGAAGAGTAAAMRGKPAVLAAETRLSFRIGEPVVITERLN